MRKFWGKGRGRRLMPAPIGVEAPKREEIISEKKKTKIIRVPVRAKHPLCMLIIGCFIITVFIIALDYIIMPDMAVDSLFYHWQIKIVGYLFGTDTGIPRLLWPVVIGIIAVVGYRVVPKMIFFEGHRTHTIYYNPLKHTGDSETETITTIWSGKKYKMDKNFIKSHGMNLFIVGNVSRSTAKETGVILLQTKDLEITKSEQKDNINRMLRDMLLDIREALESGEDRKAILNYFKRQTEYSQQSYRPPYSPPR